jgi:hypothetical protein
MTKKELEIQAALGTLPFEHWIRDTQIPSDFKIIIEALEDIEFLKILNSTCESLDIHPIAQLNPKQWCTYLALEALIWDRLYHVQQLYNMQRKLDEQNIK